MTGSCPLCGYPIRKYDPSKTKWVIKGKRRRVHGHCLARLDRQKEDQSSTKLDAEKEHSHQ